MIKHSSAKRILQAVISVGVLLFSASLWAADATASAGRNSIELPFAVNVAGTQLQSGKYRVEWTGTGDQVEVKFYRGNKTVVSTHANLVKDGTLYDNLSYSGGENGTKSLTQMSFGKQKCSLNLENLPAAQSAAK